MEISEYSNGTLPGVFVTQERVIPTRGGPVKHAMKRASDGYRDFGEAYFSTVEPKAIKGWKKHTRMTLNLVVASGDIAFFVADDRNGRPDDKIYVVTLGAGNHGRLTVAPGYWMAFAGASADPSLLLNIADIPHDPAEGVTLDLDEAFETKALSLL